MRLRYLIPFLAALLIHSLLAFSIRLDNAAVPLPLGDEMDSVEVDLVEAAPAATEPAAEPTPEPPQPEPVVEEPPVPPEPEPQPEPEVINEPPPPTPEPEAMVEPNPVEPPTKPKPKSATPQKPKAPPSKPLVTAAQPAANTGKPGGTGAPGSSGTSKARIRSNPNPEYPPQARKQRLEGTVTLSVSVSADGRPVSVRIVQSSGHASFDQSALKTVSTRWRFVPATAAGIPIPTTVKVPVSFRLKN